MRSLTKFVVFVFFYCVSVSHGQEAIRDRNETVDLEGPGDLDSDWEYNPDDYDIPTARPNLTSSSSCLDCKSFYPAKMQSWRAELCSKIDLCPVFGGTATASSNAENAKAAFKFEGHWTSDMLPQSELPNQWLQISFEKSRSLMFFGYDETRSEAVTSFRLQGANDDGSPGSWSEIRFRNTEERTFTKYEVTSTSKYRHYRLVVNETKRLDEQASTARESISIGNFQMCFSDDFGLSPPETGGKPFSKTNYSDTYSNRFAFRGLNFQWCSKKLQKNTEDCRQTTRGTHYRGNVHITDSGNDCMDWTRSTSGHHPDKKPSAGLSENFCRNPSNHKNPWCYTGLPRPNHWGNCDVPYCDQAGWHEEEFIGWEFKEPKTIRQFSFMTTNKNSWKTHHPTVYIFQGSNDKKNWIDLKAGKITPFTEIKENKTNEILKEKLQPFKLYRLSIKKSGWMQKGGRSGYAHVRNFIMC